MDCIWFGRRLAFGRSWAAHVPGSVEAVLQNASNSDYIRKLAELALHPTWTLRIASRFEPLLIDFCNRWIIEGETSNHVNLTAFCAISRLISLHPTLAIYAAELALKQRRRILSNVGTADNPDFYNSLSDSNLVPLLLALYRYLRHSDRTFRKLFSGPQIQALFGHQHACVRYLALKIHCIYLGAADAVFQSLVDKHVPAGAAQGPWDHIEIDYRYLDLWEKRLGGIYNDYSTEEAALFEVKHPQRILHLWDLAQNSTVLGKTLQPTFADQADKQSSLIANPTTNRNLEQLGVALLDKRPVLLTGSIGSGKSLLVREAARIYSKHQTLLTLHLNEQTDAKLLIGMYTSSTSPGSFRWRPGVLTTAVMEGRWALIEDLDRAPPEVMSALLPLMEKRQLHVPNLGGMITAHHEFRLFATTRTLNKQKSQHVSDNAPHQIGARHWTRVSVEALSTEDLKVIILKQLPLLQRWTDRLLSIYNLLVAQHGQASSSGERTGIQRLLGPQDLFKCCRRVNQLLLDTGAETGEEAASEILHDHIFLEIIDCFVGFTASSVVRERVTSVTAQILELPPQRRDYCLNMRTPRQEIKERRIQLGRVSLSQCQPQKRDRADGQSNRPFAYTNDVLRKMESLAAAVRSHEPCLLVGETGTGKTTAIQELAKIAGQKLVVVNLSQQSEAGDLLGGYKPMSLRSFATPLKDEFDDLFSETVTKDQNEKFVRALSRAFSRSEYSRLLKLWRQAVEMVKSKIAAPTTDDNPAKRRKIEKPRKHQLRLRWDDFESKLNILEAHIRSGDKGFAFHFMEGNIVKAVRNGDWVLLDEINLASPDTLESLADLLTTDTTEHPSLILTETGNVERILAHRDFRIFAAMNPATDVGKRDLPLSLRTRFTEFYMTSPDRDPQSLLQIVEACLGSYVHQDPRASQSITNLYLEIVKLEEDNKLVDGANQRPHYSLRTLTRTLSYVLEIAPLYGLRRSLYEGFSMGFLTLLDQPSASSVLDLISKHILPKSQQERRSLLNRTPKAPSDGKEYVRFEHYWLRKGSQNVSRDPKYIITKFIRANLLNLVRAASTRRFPVLLQGPTSSGKTSMVEYLAKISGNTFVRINNHEHTDLQEYLGTYVSDNEGNLHFQEGILVQALRLGHWIVLDELNLAPSDILEALNRLLDDNRELLIPETQEVVRPHGNFMLFATQNPAGLYGGRKTLSRAFRNRFLELHFDDIPEGELEEILTQRTQIAPSHAATIIKIYRRLAELRQSSRLFEQKGSFANLRDLFRWALRGITTKEELALHGYMLLAERVRKEEEREAVRTTIQEITKVKLDAEALYGSPSLTETIDTAGGYAENLVWTASMRRIYVLVTEALKRNEPVLLVGGTGCGKTSVCQVIAEMAGTKLHILNAHQTTETGDLIGAQRPIRNRASANAELEANMSRFLIAVGRSETEVISLESLIEAFRQTDLGSVAPELLEEFKMIQAGIAKHKALFEWSDGSLVQAMRQGTHFLLDEISLADDAVLERLNSALESGRTILLAEKGPEDSLVTASDGFQFLATMNPGGDFGKRELSPALRNRFTEIWVPPVSSQPEVAQIAEAKLAVRFKPYATSMVAFAFWFGQTFHPNGPSLSIRDILSWAGFLDACQSLDTHAALVEGAAMVYIDALGANPAANLSLASSAVREAKVRCLDQLSMTLQCDCAAIYFSSKNVSLETGALHVGNFSLLRTPEADHDKDFSFQAHTTVVNMARVVRALQLSKPLLLEGSPGVGKTTLVAALAHATGISLTRINLSEQTDLMDLFGSDVPVEGGEAGQFAWRDAPFLQSMQKGEWVLLDEMNLASQSVLEGLNACLDHRGQVFIPELDQTFARHPNFRIFAAQNPHSQGGGRKGLPGSFVNRFTVVYADAFSSADLVAIACDRFSQVEGQVIKSIVRYVMNLEKSSQVSATVAAAGGPWEFNLRDILRWLQLVSRPASPTAFAEPQYFQEMLFLQRLRSTDAVKHAQSSMSVNHEQISGGRSLYRNLTSTSYQVGLAILPRDQSIANAGSLLEPASLPLLESVMLSIVQNWPVLLVGSSGSGKTSLIQHIATMTGHDLLELPLSADMDTMDIVGGYEQADNTRLAAVLTKDFKRALKLALIGNELSDASVCWKFLAEQREQHLEFDAIGDFLRAVTSTPCKKIWSDLLARYSQAAEDLSRDTRARFEWTDGVLIQALESGKWLVLDNANLCSSSVLDRLNSLLEPNGFLAINEHRLPDGTARIVCPHPDFRIFLTMDPRHGELSRAMRNRCVELYMPPRFDMPSSSSSLGVDIGDSALFRLSPLISSAWSHVQRQAVDRVLSIAFDALAFNDRPIIDSLHSQMVKGLCPAFLSDDDLSRSSISACISAWKEPTAFKAATLGLYEMALGQLVGCGALQTVNESLHPLNNSMLLSVVLRSSDRAQTIPRLIAILSESWIETRYRLTDLKQRRSDLIEGTRTPSSCLDRSIMADQVLAFAKEKTAPISRALYESFSHLQNWLSKQDGSGLRMSDALWVSRTSAFLRDLTSLTDTANIDDALVQAHLSHGHEIISAGDPSPDLQAVVASILQQLDNLRSKWQLQTGHAMKSLWQALRPQTATTESQKDTLHDLERAMSQLSTSLAEISMPYAAVAQMKRRVIEVYQQICNGSADTESSKQILASIKEFVHNSGSKGVPRRTYFRRSFQGFLQLLELSQASASTLGTLEVAACRPLRSQGHGIMQSGFSTALHQVQQASGVFLDEQPLEAVNQRTMPLFLIQLDSTDKVSIGSLDDLRREFQELPKALVSLCGTESVDPLYLLNTRLNTLHLQCFEALRSNLDPEFGESYADQLLKGMSVNSSEKHLPPLDTAPQTFNAEATRETQALIEKYLMPSIALARHSDDSGTLDIKSSAGAWISFFAVCLLLYLPDKPFDPSLQSTIVLKSYQNRRLQLQESLNALTIYESIKGHVQKTPRSQLVADALIELGDEPSSAKVLRPTQSLLGRLSGDLTNIINSIVNHCLEIKDMQPTTLESIGTNIERAIQRLHDSYSGYEDIVQPAIQLLIGLRIGISLGVDASRQDQSTVEIPRVMQLSMPLFDFTRPKFLSIKNKDLPRGSKGEATRLLYLQAAAVDTRVAGTMAPSIKYLSQQIFDAFYTTWSVNLTKDQKNQAARNSLYRYRDMSQDQQDDQETRAELRKVFPTYDTDSEETSMAHSEPNTSHDPSSLARKLAGLHSRLFHKPPHGSSGFDELNASSANMLAKFLSGKHDHSLFSTSAHRFLPVAIFSLSESSKSLSTHPSQPRRDFYRDANLIEVGKIHELAKRIQQRFEELHNEWPEQAAPMDVLHTITQLLDMAHTDPVAKLLTKAEQLHGYIYQWEQVASRQYSASSLYTEITNLLLSWRRLELSSWASVLDVEAKNCEEEAESWWFVAYETIIGASLSAIHDGKDLADHIIGLTETLAEFVKTTCLGQYNRRLKMLEDFMLHVQTLSADQPQLRDLVMALLNLVAYFRRFQGMVDERLKEGRLDLDKKMKEIILLTSWKDTNIEALRQSSRQSHVKLFKIIRKYRELLGEPAEGPLQREVPLQSPTVVATTEMTVTASSKVKVVPFDQGRHVPFSSDAIPGHLQNVDFVVRTMHRICQYPESNIKVADHLQYWTSQIVEESKSLQKETPAKLTEDSKAEIQHLKVRKRRLFAQVLKDLRVMGLKTNIDTHTLEAQSTTMRILATSQTVRSENAGGNGDNEFFRVLDNLSKCHELIRNPSEDLAGPEVSRSLVHVQGLVELVISQRHSLYGTDEALKALQSLCEPLCALSEVVSSGDMELQGSSAYQRYSTTALVKWMPVSLAFASNLLNMHDEMEGQDSSNIRQQLNSFRHEFGRLLTDLETVPVLPDPATTKSGNLSYTEVSELCQRLQKAIELWSKESPYTKFATNLINNWLIPEDESQASQNGFTLFELSKFESHLFKLADRVLKNLENSSRQMSKLPTRDDENAWLIRSTNVQQKILSSLDISTVCSSLKSLLSSMTSISDKEVLIKAASVLSYITPIFSSYRDVCQSLFNHGLAQYRSTISTTRILSDNFCSLLSNGFCGPKEESKSDRSDQEKLEEGTGLGEGEGAEDISKDIQDDEDLSELAQDKKPEGAKEDEVEGEDNAVDMADQDLEGEMDENGEQKDLDEDKNDDDADADGPDEELGDVGNDDPEAIDEELWDADKQEQERNEEKTSEQKAGKKTDQQAGEGEGEQAEAADEEEEGVNDDEETDMDAEINDSNMPDLDPHLQQDEKLDLPDDIEMDADQKSVASESDLEEADEIEDGDEQAQHIGDEAMSADEDKGADDASPEETQPEDLQDGQDADVEHYSESEADDPEGESNPLREQEKTAHDAEDQLQGETDGLAGSGDTEEVEQENAQAETGGTDGQTGMKDETHGAEDQTHEEQQTGAGASGESAAADDSLQDSAEAQAFKKLGDALERFQRSSRDIRQAQTTENKELPQDGEVQDAVEFEHLPDDHVDSETQALGNADEEQAKGLDNGAMDLDVPERDAPETAQVLETADSIDPSNEDKATNDPHANEVDPPHATSVGQQRAKEGEREAAEDEDSDDYSSEEDMRELDDGLSEVHLQPSAAQAINRSAEESLQLWQQCELRTNELAMYLTEQLRLILTPQLATKMSGDYRTGKRLNMKRIIPYIASDYKRDKIWKRRSVPTKRNYQIMIAVDDSKSMDEPGTGSSRLAFETLALVSRSLTMLEAGQLCVVGFGEEVHIAHAFDQPFSLNAGASILQQFQFQQTKTDVRRLLEESLRLFREARAQNQTTGAELWQIQFIVSDGICDDHESIRQLVRQALQEQIIIVFIVVDALKGTSIQSLEEATFEVNPQTGKSELRMKRYLAEFPFDYYMIVGDVEALPGVLAEALRRWFAEVTGG